MRIELVLDRRHVRRWLLQLIEQLEAVPGVELRLRHAPAQPLPRLASSLFQLESLLYGIPSGYAVELVAETQVPARPAGDTEPDLLIDVTATVGPARVGPATVGPARADDATPLLSLTSNGLAPDVGALQAVLGGSAPVLEVDLQVNGGSRAVLRWSVAVEDHSVATRAMGNIMGRAVQAVVSAVKTVDAPPGPHVAPNVAAGAGMGGRRPAPVPWFVTSTLVHKVQARIRRLVSGAPRWHTGWRSVGSTTAAVTDLHGQTYQRVVDDGQRFFADPFPWSHQGQTFVFMEEYPFATGRGIISVSELVDGRLGSPRPVLEVDCHLSYPFLIEDQGVTYMIPETSNRNTVELWRSTSFPTAWVQERVLIEGENLSDATVVHHEGIWYMFAAQSQRWTSGWDALAVFWAPSLFGPWSPHENNPVLVDVSSARPAGNVLRLGGDLVRPVQNCTARYGEGLGFARVDRLTPRSFQQTTLVDLRPAAPLTGLHTFNRGGGIEVVDVFGSLTEAAFTI